TRAAEIVAAGTAGQIHADAGSQAVDPAGGLGLEAQTQARLEVGVGGQGNVVEVGAAQAALGIAQGPGTGAGVEAQTAEPDQDAQGGVTAQAPGLVVPGGVVHALHAAVGVGMEGAEEGGGGDHAEEADQAIGAEDLLARSALGVEHQAEEVPAVGDGRALAGEAALLQVLAEVDVAAALDGSG